MIRSPSGPDIRMLRPLTMILFVLAFALSGCVGRKEAIDLSGSLKETSAKVETAVKALQKYDEAQVKAHITTRNTVRALLDQSRQARVDQAKASLRAAYQEAMGAVDREQLKLLRNAAEDRKTVNAKIESILATQLAPLQKEQGALEAKAVEAAAAAKKFPDDKELRAEKDHAAKEYFAVSVAAMDIELRARMMAAEGIDQAYTQFVSDLANSAETHKQKIKNVYDRVMADLDKHSAATATDLGPDPVTNTEVYQALAEYARSVGHASDAYQNYLSANSFGSGSFLSDFLKSFGSGLSSGLVDGKAPGAVDFSKVKEAAQPVLDQVVGSLKEQLTDAKDTAIAAIQDKSSGLPRILESAALAAGRTIADDAKSKRAAPTDK